MACIRQGILLTKNVPEGIEAIRPAWAPHIGPGTVGTFSFFWLDFGHSEAGRKLSYKDAMDLELKSVNLLVTLGWHYYATILMKSISEDRDLIELWREVHRQGSTFYSDLVDGLVHGRDVKFLEALNAVDAAGIPRSRFRINFSRPDGTRPAPIAPLVPFLIRNKIQHETLMAPAITVPGYSAMSLQHPNLSNFGPWTSPSRTESASNSPLGRQDPIGTPRHARSSSTTSISVQTSSFLTPVRTRRNASAGSPLAHISSQTSPTTAGGLTPLLARTSITDPRNHSSHSLSLSTSLASSPGLSSELNGGGSNSTGGFGGGVFGAVGRRIRHGYSASLPINVYDVEGQDAELERASRRYQEGLLRDSEPDFE